MMRNKKYWIDRANRRMDDYMMSAFDEARIINRSYNSLELYIKGEMAKILRHIGDEDSLAYEYRMKRLNALLLNTDKKFKELYGVNLHDTTAFLKSIIPEAYYHTIFDIAQGIGKQPEFAAVPEKLINKIIHEDWSGENYSKRIWANTNALAEEVREVLTEAAVNGESIYKTSKKIADKFDTSEYNARRLIRTETTYACNQAEQVAYKELDIEKYQFVATLDTRTSTICQQLDGKVFKVEDAQAGKNLPAMHPNCRSTTIPYFKEGMPEIRTARDKDGNRITVPASMTYDEWHKKYIEPYEKPKEKPKAKAKPAEIKASEAKPLTIFEEQEQNREKIDKALHSVEEERRNLTHEVGTIIDRQGNIINVTDGQEHSVSPPEDLLKDNIFTHNHPSGGIFSAGDLEAMIGDELLELRASTPQGTYYSLRRIGAVPKDMEFMEEYKKSCNYVKACEAVTSDLKSGKLTKEAARQKGYDLYTEYMANLGDEFLTNNAEKYGYIYTKGVI